FTDAHLQRLYAGLLEPGDVAFAISQSGRSVEVNESIQIAKERGATTIALTNAGSRLAWVVDIPLLLRVPESEAPEASHAAPHAPPHAPDVSRIAHLAVIDALAMGVALGLGPRAPGKMRDARARGGEEGAESAGSISKQGVAPPADDA
ncbi:MAG: SIS domain-containing protein, partial [Paraburkholderia sp.]|nr:SIS domain-containing protein [Paraburkholderia sp.]